jgi:hypothetical protein
MLFLLIILSFISYSIIDTSIATPECFQNIYSNYQKNDSIIVWRDTERIKWSDFKYSTVDTFDFAEAAQISTSISYRYNVINDIITFEIIALMHKENSWTTDTLSNDLLEHEQLHFDLTELFARKMRKGVITLKSKGVIELTQYIDLINNLQTEYYKEQRNYDEETMHGSNHTSQEIWNEKIRSELMKLERYRLIELRK